MAPRSEDYDEFCDPDNPKTLKYQEAVDAADRIKNHIIKTPCVPSKYQEKFTINLYYKLEFLQKTGSFKDRGAVNMLELLPMDKRKIGIVVASLGNFGSSVSYYASKMHVPVIVVLPVTVGISKVQRCHANGAKVIIQGNNLFEAQRHAKALAKEKGMTYINSRDHPHVLAGYASLGVEIMNEAPFVDAVMVSVGSGGLAAAVTTVVKHVKPDCLVYGVQSEEMPTFYESLVKNEPVNLVMNDTMADAIAVPTVGVNAFHNVRPLLDKMLLVKEDWIARAMLHLKDVERYVVEPAGACPLAAIVGDLVPEFKIKNVVCVLSGGNVEMPTYGRCLERGLASDARLIKFTVGVLNTPVALTNLLQMLSNNGYNLERYVRHNEWTEDPEYNVEMDFVVTADGLEHALQLKRMMDRTYPCLVTFATEPFNDKRTCPCYVKKTVC